MDCKKYFLDKYENDVGIPYYFTGKDAKALSLLLPKIKSINSKKLAGAGDQDHLDFFKILIERLPAWYRKNNYSLSVINSKFQEIISQLNIKNNGINTAEHNRQADEYLKQFGNPYARK